MLLNDKRFDADLALAGSALSTAKTTIQNLLVTACYHVLQSGNPEKLNKILHVVQEGKTADVTRLTKWVTLHAKCAILREGKFVQNEKVRKELNVTNWETFKDVEAHLRSMFWTDITGKTPAKNPWDIDEYLASVLKQMEKHYKDEGVSDTTKEAIEMASREVKAVKGRIALMMVQE